MAEFFQNIWQSIVSLFTVQITVWDILDIILVAVLLYMLLKITRQNRAYMVLKGLGILLAVAVVTSWRLAFCDLVADVHAAAMGCTDRAGFVSAGAQTGVGADWPRKAFRPFREAEKRSGGIQPYY